MGSQLLSGVVEAKEGVGTSAIKYRKDMQCDIGSENIFFVF